MQRNIPELPHLPTIVDDIDNDAVLIESAIHFLEKLNAALPNDACECKSLTEKIYTLLNHWAINHECLMEELIYKVDWE